MEDALARAEHPAREQRAPRVRAEQGELQGCQGTLSLGFSIHVPFRRSTAVCAGLTLVPVL